MTTITFYRNKESGYTGFVCFGHAEYAKKHFFHKEPDILCAGISALVFHTINSLSELAHEELEVNTNEDTGFIKCDFKSCLKDNSLFLVNSLIFSLEQMSKQYGEKYLTVKFEEV